MPPSVLDTSKHVISFHSVSYDTACHIRCPQQVPGRGLRVPSVYSAAGACFGHDGFPVCLAGTGCPCGGGAGCRIRVSGASGVRRQRTGSRRDCGGGLGRQIPQGPVIGAAQHFPLRCVSSVSSVCMHVCMCVYALVIALGGGLGCLISYSLVFNVSHRTCQVPVHAANVWWR